MSTTPSFENCFMRLKARSYRDLVTVIGHAATISAGEWVTASGEWVNDFTHGKQFKAYFLRCSAQTTIERIEKYLGSGVIRVVGPVYARLFFERPHGRRTEWRWFSMAPTAANASKSALPA